MDPEILQGVITQEFEMLPPQLRGFESVTYCHARVGGLELRYPKALAYADDV
jgi:hypothetical protein